MARLDGQSATRLLSQLNDRLTSQLITLLVPRFRLPTVDWCWLALGSEGRHEQTFVTDQDNGLIFQASQGWAAWLALAVLGMASGDIAPAAAARPALHRRKI